MTLIALFVAPLAVPATAAMPQARTAACATMDMGSSSHPMPAGHHRAGEPCCTAIGSAIAEPRAALVIAPRIDHPEFVALAEAFSLGAGPKAEDPPPRRA